MADIQQPRLTLMAAYVEILTGISIFASRDELGSAAYQFMRPYFIPISAALLISGMLLLIIGRSRPHTLWRRLLHSLTAVPLAVLAVARYYTNAYPGVPLYGLLALAVLVVPWLDRAPGPQSPAARPHSDPGVITLAAIDLVVGLQLLLRPDLFSGSAYQFMFPFIDLVGAAGILGAIALLWPVRGGAIAAGGGTLQQMVGALLPAVMTYNAFRYGGWTGTVVWLVLTLSVVPSLPTSRWAQPRRSTERIGDLSAAQIDDFMHAGLWTLAFLVVLLNLVSGAGAVASALQTNLFVGLIATYNVVVFWAVPGLGTPAHRAESHFWFLVTAVSILLIMPGHVGHGFLGIIMLAATAAARTLGRPAGFRVLGISLFAILASAVIEWQMGQALALATGEALLDATLLLVVSLGGIQLGGKQHEQEVALTQAQVELQRDVEHLTLLGRISRDIRQSLEAEKILAVATQELGTTLGVSRCFIRFPHKDGSMEVNHQYLAPGIDFPPENRVASPDIMEPVVALGELFVLDDLSAPETAGRLHPDQLAYLQSAGVRSVLALWLTDEEHVIGMLALHQCDRVRHWEPHEIKLVSALGDHLAVAIRHARMLEEAQAQTEEVQAQGEELLAQNQVLSEQSSTLALQRSQLEEALAAAKQATAANQRLISILEETPDFVSMANSAGDRVYINAAGLEILGMADREQALGLPAIEAYAPWARERLVNEAIPQATRTGKWQGETALLTEDRREVPVLQSLVVHRNRTGEVEYLSCLARDISEQKQNEIALRESELRYRTLVESMQDGFFTVAEGRILMANPAAAAMVGYPPAELIGMPFIALVAPEDRSMVLESYASRTRGNTDPVFYELRLLHRDGHTRTHVSMSVGVTVENGKIASIGTLHNITERKRMEEALRLSEARYRLLVEKAPTPIAVHQVDRLLFMNAAFLQLVGAVPVADLSCKPLAEFIHPDDWSGFRASLQELLAGRCESLRQELRILGLQGQTIAVDITSTVTVDGGEPAVQTVMLDITERKQYESQLMQLADFDTLTGLFNRRRIQQELEEQVARALKSDSQGALLFLDLDQFKYVNDSLGHASGDRLLHNLAAVLQQHLRENDIVGRLGGDEFAILVHGADEPAARMVAERLLEGIRSHVELMMDQPVSVTASIGIALFPAHGTTAAEILARADVAMYQAKERGRNAVAVFAPEQGQQAQMESKLNWERRIRMALEQDRFVLYAQPIWSIDRGEVVQYEVLLRMLGDNDELILPGAFLDTAERFGLIQEIDRWVVRQSIHLIAQAQELGQELHLEVNLSGKSIQDAELLAVLQNELSEHAIDHTKLILEITETSAIENMTQARIFVETLKAMGCRFAVDDFGAGFSSFAYLKLLQVDYLKIDGSLVQHLPDSADDQELVKAIAGLARGLGKQTIAEFVEDEATLGLLKELGVDFAQGFHVGYPAPAEGVLKG